MAKTPYVNAREFSDSSPWVVAWTCWQGKRIEELEAENARLREMLGLPQRRNEGL